MDKVESVHNKLNSYKRDNKYNIFSIKPEDLLVKRHYHYHNESGTRWHFFEAKLNNESLRGDALKTKILHKISSQIIKCDNEEALNKTIEDFKNSDDYKILKTSQGLFSWFFSIKTSSLKAFEDVCHQQRAQLATIETHPFKKT